MKLRRLSATDDLAGAIDLLQRFFREEGFDTPDEVIASNTRTMVQLDVCAILVAESEGRTVGVATLSMEFGIEYGWSAEMGDLYVIPEMRGKGVSRRLVEEAERVLRERGAIGYQVTVTPYAEEHHGLRRFYLKLGFEDEGRAILFRYID